MKSENTQAFEKKLLPIGARQEFVDFEGGRVRLLTGGEKTNTIPILLIHGGGTDNAAISWYRLFEPLSKKYRVLALDLPGFGLTSGIDSLGGPRRMADFIVRLMNTLFIKEAHVCGVSMGGDVALNIGLYHPAFSRSLTLIAPGGLVPLVKNKFTHTSVWLAAKMPDWMLFPLARIANKFVKTLLKKMVNNPDVLPVEVVEEFYSEAQKPRSGEGYARYNQATIGPWGMTNNLLDSVHKITIPVLFFHGESDPIVDKKGSIAASKRMPNAKLILIDNCGHWVQLEEHDVFLKEFLSFIENK